MKQAQAGSGRKEGATDPVTIKVHEYLGRGTSFGFISTGQPCACGRAELLLHRPLLFSRQPICDAARILLDTGYSPKTAIVMTRNGAEPALRTTIGRAAGLAVKASATGVPIFVKCPAGDKRRARRCAIRAPGRGGPARNASAGLALYSKQRSFADHRLTKRAV
jgi:hypothetical protein